MLRVMIVLGLLVLVPAALVFWRSRERSAVDMPADERAKAIGSSAVDRPLDSDPKALPHDGLPVGRR